MEKNNSFDFDSACKKAIKELGKVNILIAGKTGVGKSTLINAVFGKKFANTGCGRPVTQSMKEYSMEGNPLHIFDTKGFELDGYESMLDDVRNIINTRKTTEASEHIHIAWYCVANEGDRLEDSEAKFIEELQKQIPVILVLTKSYGAQGNLLKSIKSEYYSVINNYVEVLAEPFETVLGPVPVKGLNELVLKTDELIPEAARRAFRMAQQVNKDLVKKSVDNIIKAASAMAFAFGATPIPFADAAVLAPIQVTMLASISYTMGLSLDRGFLATLVTSAAGVTGAVVLGKTIVSGLLRLIPGAGLIIGGSISGGVAASLTTAMGYAYYKAVDAVLSSGEDFSAEELAEIFKDNLKKE